MRLRDWMLNNNILIHQVANKTGIPRFDVWQIMTGNRVATPKEALLIEEFSNDEITLDMLLFECQMNPDKKIT